jgi:hypothetical protein
MAEVINCVIGREIITDKYVTEGITNKPRTNINKQSAKTTSIFGLTGKKLLRKFYKWVYFCISSEETITNLTFMGPCIGNVFFQIYQQDATLHNILYCCQCSTCLSRNDSPTLAVARQAWHIPDAVCTVFELLMMGGETVWNMYSIDNKKEYCVTLHLVVILERINDNNKFRNKFLNKNESKKTARIFPFTHSTSETTKQA